jgi:hypothetical protein
MNALAIQQLYQQGVQLAQAGWMCENLGNLMGAGRTYQQAVQVLEACGRFAGVQPLDRLYWLGCCQLRLGWLTYLAGNPLWAQGWFNLAQASLGQLCQLEPNNAAYLGLFQQVQQHQAPSGTQDGGGSPLLGLLKKGLGMLPELIQLFKCSGGGHGHSGNTPPGWMGGMGGAWGGGNGGWGNWLGGDWAA